MKKHKGEIPDWTTKPQKHKPKPLPGPVEQAALKNDLQEEFVSLWSKYRDLGLENDQIKEAVVQVWRKITW